jgi:hypothetical protein
MSFKYSKYYQNFKDCQKVRYNDLDFSQHSSRGKKYIALLAVDGGGLKGIVPS